MTVTWDLWLRRFVGKAQTKWQRRRREALHPAGAVEQNISPPEPVELTTRNAASSGPSTETLHRRHDAGSTTNLRTTDTDEHHQRTSTVQIQPPSETDTQSHAIPIGAGLCIIGAFFGMFLSFSLGFVVLNSEI